MIVFLLKLFSIALCVGILYPGLCRTTIEIYFQERKRQ